MQDFIIIVQARMSSTRMAGKILQPFYEGQHILGIQIERLKRVFHNHKVVLATTQNPADDAVENAGLKLGVEVFRGDEQNVLQRFIDCAEKYNAQMVMRVCSDNPFLNGFYAKQLADYAQHLAFDYLSFKDNLNTPAIKTHWGLFAEMVSVHALQKAAKSTSENLYQEHVTNYIYGHPQMFKVEFLDAPSEVFHRHDLRFTIDTPEDFKAAQELYTKCENGSLEELIREADKNEHIKATMKTGIDKFSK